MFQRGRLKPPTSMSFMIQVIARFRNSHRSIGMDTNQWFIVVFLHVTPTGVNVAGLWESPTYAATMATLDYRWGWFLNLKDPHMYQKVIPSPEYEKSPRNHALVGDEPPYLGSLKGCSILVGSDQKTVSATRSNRQSVGLKKMFCCSFWFPNWAWLLFDGGTGLHVLVLKNITCVHMKSHETRKTDTSIGTWHYLTQKKIGPRGFWHDFVVAAPGLNRYVEVWEVGNPWILLDPWSIT